MRREALFAFLACVAGPAVAGPVSFQADAGVGDDLFPDIGFAGDVGSGLVRRAGQGFHALLAVRLSTSGALSALVRIAFSVATISGGVFDDTTTAYQLVAA